MVKPFIKLTIQLSKNNVAGRSWNVKYLALSEYQLPEWEAWRILWGTIQEEGLLAFEDEEDEDDEE